jgi:hypothetical protein
MTVVKTAAYAIPVYAAGSGKAYMIVGTEADATVIASPRPEVGSASVPTEKGAASLPVRPSGPFERAFL